MSRVKNNLTGKCFGNWTVLGETDTRKINDKGHKIGPKGISKWRCRCICGVEKPAVLYTSLVRGESKSCGACHLSGAPSSKAPQRRSHDITGKTFGRWTVIQRSERPNRWVCQCSCGNVKDPTTGAIIHGTSTSCGCAHKEMLRAKTKNLGKGEHLRHNQNNAVYLTWQSMKTRCTNKKAKVYKLYGARGISVHPEWLKDFTSFATYLGPKPSVNHSLERIDNNGNYEPGNVRWATKVEQAENTRNNPEVSYQGRTIRLRDLADELGIERSVFRYHYLLRSKTVEQVIEEVEKTRADSINWKAQGKPSLSPKTSFIDYTNTKFGVWTVLRYEGRKAPNYPSRWSVKCGKCGEEKIVTSYYIKEGKLNLCTRERRKLRFNKYPPIQPATAYTTPELTPSDWI